MKRRLLIGKSKDLLYSILLWYKFRKFHQLQRKNPPRKVIYTCITGGYDCLVLNMYLNPEYKYVCFTDDETYLKRRIVGPWHIEPLRYDRLDNTRNNRYHKMHPHELFSDYEESLFIDANIQLRGNCLFAAADAMHGRDVFLAIPPHRRCRCLYDELEECIRSHKDNAEVLEKHRIFLEEEGYPRQMGLTENNVIYRKHKDPRCIKVMEDWWYMVENYSRRDQLSLFYVLWKNGEQMTYLLDFPIKSDHN